MNWIPLTDLNQLQDIQKSSNSPSIRAVLIFKHSTRCGVSRMVLKGFESDWQNSDAIPSYYLDLLSYRAISNQLADMYGIEHQSPQVLLIKNEKCIYSASHNAINAEEVLSKALPA